MDNHTFPRIFAVVVGRMHSLDRTAPVEHTCSMVAVCILAPVTWGCFQEKNSHEAPCDGAPAAGG